MFTSTSFKCNFTIVNKSRCLKSYFAKVGNVKSSSNGYNPNRHISSVSVNLGLILKRTQYYQHPRDFIYKNNYGLFSNLIASFFRFHTSAEVTKEVFENVPSKQLPVLKRPQRRKRQTLDESDKPSLGLRTVMAFATAEEYDLERLKAGLIKQDLYKPVHLCSGDELNHTAPLTGCLSHSIARFPMTHCKGRVRRGGKNHEKATDSGCTRHHPTPSSPLHRLPQPAHTLNTPDPTSSHSSDPRQFPSTAIFAPGYESNRSGFDSQLLPWVFFPKGELPQRSPGFDIPDMLYAVASYQVDVQPREIFFFREGSVVLWNVTELECGNVLNFLRQYEQISYDERVVQEESEFMTYEPTQTSKCSHLQNGTMFLIDDAQSGLDKYTFSNALALSVKLGIWEASLDSYVDSIEYITDDLKKGIKIKISQEDVLRKTGELFALRHHINLSSDLLDTPDFYWDHEQQEALYQQMCSYLSISRRTRVMNEKLNHCVELVELLSSHLSDRHHVRLEWMIIVLIMVEMRDDRLSRQTEANGIHRSMLRQKGMKGQLEANENTCS
ncbi:unnamed protein product [Timema podura]|uniref:DUF155 domain-containing protein n=1 Tax=Timema podura TaxID=61482 RepID=A0ABN7NK89_TIMPD|nr:unnamed protein product [Timema podura]